MVGTEAGWDLAGLSDDELLHGLDGVIRLGRRALAELLAHLAEVEERRLHLRAAYPSLFSYCVSRLGFSEDEACRRIDVARLARQYLALFPLLASGEISLSVAALLKPHLSAANSQQLLAAVTGKTVQQAREALAAHFPRPDVPSRVRKLPERSVGQPSPVASVAASSVAVAPVAVAPVSGGSTRPAGLPPVNTTVPSAAPSTPPLSLRPPTSPQRVAPLAPARYKIELTADAELKAKLELARDLMRHANPNGDFAPILSRALDLLIADIQKRRFGARSKTAALKASAAPVAPSHSTPSSRHVPRAARRRIVERDGLRCCWTNDAGRRCNSQAWLEHDHQVPHGKGGGSGEGNLRLFCRSHNRLEAERQFGRQHVDGAIARAQRSRSQTRGERDQR